MVIAVVGIATMLALLDESLRKRRVRLLVIGTRYKLFALRDKLRRDAIERKSAEYQWFGYMDSTITATIDYVEDMNLWSILSLLKKYEKRSGELQKKRKDRNRDFRKKENAWLKESLDGFGVILTEYLRQRHVLIFSFILMCMKVGHWKKSLLTWRSKVADAISVTPPTSTLAACG